MVTLSAAFSLLNLLLPLLWETSASVTYTVQHSRDLVEWFPFHAVFEGDGQPQALTLDLAGSPAFARIRSDADGDTNENGLPDHWEWSALGRLDVDPSADPDLDGLTNAEEWIQETDPLNYYNGIQPVLEVTGGKNWIVPSGSVSHSSFSAVLRFPSGEPWADAPITIRVSSGSPTLLQGESLPQDLLHEVTCRTDFLGRLPVGPASIHFKAGTDSGTTESVVLQAGNAMDSVTITIVEEGFRDPPRNLREEEFPDGSVIYHWSGPASSASSFLIEKEGPNGDWINIVTLTASEIPSPDPITGIHEFLLSSP